MSLSKPLTTNTRRTASTSPHTLNRTFACLAARAPMRKTRRPALETYSSWAQSTTTADAPAPAIACSMACWKPVEASKSSRPTGTASVTPAAELFTRWLTSRDWQGPDGQPLALPRRPPPDDAPSFELLARSITTDVHPRTLLDELIRLELVALDMETDRVVLRADSFVPAVQLQTMLGFLGANVGDHLAAARANVAASLRSAQQPDATPIRPPFVEQALFADGLSAQSITVAIEQARLFWGTLLRTLAPELERLEAQDQADARPADQRIRIGLYCYAEPTHPLLLEKPSGQHD